MSKAKNWFFGKKGIDGIRDESEARLRRPKPVTEPAEPELNPGASDSEVVLSTESDDALGSDSEETLVSIRIDSEDEPEPETEPEAKEELPLGEIPFDPSSSADDLIANDSDLVSLSTIPAQGPPTPLRDSRRQEVAQQELAQQEPAEQSLPEPEPVPPQLERSDSGRFEVMNPNEAAAMLDQEIARTPRPQQKRAPVGGGSVRSILEQRSEDSTLMRLAKRGIRNVKVLDLATVERIVSEAVDVALDKRGGSMSVEERKRLERSAKREFLDLLERHQKVVAEKSEVEEKRDSLDAQVERLEAELDSQVAKLERERAEDAGAKATFSEDSFGRMADHIRSTFKTLMRDENRLALIEHGPKAVRGFREFEAQMLGMLDGLIGEELKKAIGEERAAQGTRISILEARIAKLNSALGNTEDALRRVSAMKAIDMGTASIYDGVQGLNLDAFDFERKTELLKEIFVQNLELQGKDVTAGDLEGLSRPAAEPTPEAPILAAPLDFAPPVDVESLTDEMAF